MKQTKLRKRRVIRYAILYFVLLVVFLALIVGPIVAGTKFKLDLPSLPMDILQPTGYSNNNTNALITGSCIQDNCPPYRGGPAKTGGADGTADSGGAAATTDAAAKMFRRYMAY